MGPRKTSCDVDSCIIGTQNQMSWILSSLQLQSVESVVEQALHGSPKHSSAPYLVFIWKSQLFGSGVFVLKLVRKKWLLQNHLHYLMVEINNEKPHQIQAFLLQGVIQYKRFSFFLLLNPFIQLPTERRHHLDVTLWVLLCRTLLLVTVWNLIHPPTIRNILPL